MHKALEDKSEEAQRLREELQGTTFQFDSQGRAHAGGQMQNIAGNSALAVKPNMHSVHMMQSA